MFVVGPKKELKYILKLVGPRRNLYFFKFIYFILFSYVLYMCMFPVCCFRQSTYMLYVYVSSSLLSSENICGTRPC